MLYFVNDYSEGAHEKILQHLIDTNMEQLAGYGMDHYCESAKEKIKKACGCEDAEVFLLTGGTQTNQIVIDTLLQPYEGVVAAQTGHVSTHEPVQSNLPDIKFWNFHRRMARSVQQIFRNWKRDFMEMRTTSIWFSRGWSIFLIRQSMEPCIPEKNWKSCQPYAENTKCPCTLTVQD